MSAFERVEALARKDEHVTILLRNLLTELEQHASSTIPTQDVKEKVNEILKVKAAP